MEIDITIVAAQIVNFALLVWLLNRLLYRPIVNVISARENAVKQRLQHAESLQDEARRELAAYQAQRTELDRAREQMLKEAREEARRVREGLLQQAQDDAEHARRRLKEQLAAETAELAQSVQEGIIRQAGAVTERLLQDMGGRTMGDGVIAALERRLQKQPSLLVGVEPPLTVRLSFEPTAEQAAQVRAMLERAIGTELNDEAVAVVYDGSLLLGAEVHYDGTVLAWHARDYVSSWEQDAVKLLAGESGVERDAVGA